MLILKGTTACEWHSLPRRCLCPQSFLTVPWLFKSELKQDGRHASHATWNNRPRETNEIPMCCDTPTAPCFWKNLFQLLWLALLFPPLYCWYVCLLSQWFCWGPGRPQSLVSSPGQSRGRKRGDRVQRAALPMSQVAQSQTRHQLCPGPSSASRWAMMCGKAPQLLICSS